MLGGLCLADTCCSRAPSQKGLEQQEFGCARLWGGATFYLGLERTAFPWSSSSTVGFSSLEVPVLMSLQPQVAARKSFLQVPEVPDNALVLSRLWISLSCWAAVLSCTYKPTCKRGMQMLPACTRPSESCCNSPVPSSAFPPPSEPITLTPLPLNLRGKVEASENLLHRWCFTYNSPENVSATGAKFIYKVLKIMTECALPASRHCIVIGDKYESTVNFMYLTSFTDYQQRWLQAGPAYLQQRTKLIEMSLKPAQMIKFLHTRLCFYLFSSVTGDLQNYNVMGSAKRAGQTHLRGEKNGEFG